MLGRHIQPRFGQPLVLIEQLQVVNRPAGQRDLQVEQTVEVLEYEGLGLNRQQFLCKEHVGEYGQQRLDILSMKAIRQSEPFDDEQWIEAPCSPRVDSKFLEQAEEFLEDGGSLPLEGGRVRHLGVQELLF